MVLRTSNGLIQKLNITISQAKQGCPKMSLLCLGVQACNIVYVCQPVVDDREPCRDLPCKSPWAETSRFSERQKRINSYGYLVNNTTNFLMMFIRGWISTTCFGLIRPSSGLHGKEYKSYKTPILFRMKTWWWPDWAETCSWYSSPNKHH